MFRRGGHHTISGLHLPRLHIVMDEGLHHTPGFVLTGRVVPRQHLIPDDDVLNRLGRPITHQHLGVGHETRLAGDLRDQTAHGAAQQGAASQATARVEQEVTHRLRAVTGQIGQATGDRAISRTGRRPGNDIAPQTAGALQQRRRTGEHGTCRTARHGTNRTIDDDPTPVDRPVLDLLAHDRPTGHHQTARDHARTDWPADARRGHRHTGHQQRTTGDVLPVVIPPASHGMPCASQRALVRIAITLQLRIGHRAQPQGIGHAHRIVPGKAVRIARPRRTRNAVQRVGRQEPARRRVIHPRLHPLQTGHLNTAQSADPQPTARRHGRRCSPRITARPTLAP